MTKIQLKSETKDQQSKVVQAYLDELLQDATEPVVESEVDTSVNYPEKALAAEVKVEVEVEAPLPAVEKPALTSLEQSQRALTEISRALEKQHEEVEVVIEAEPPADPKMLEAPSWMGQDVECLLFEINQLKLAIPLSGLGSIQKPEKPLTRLFGQPEWYLGLFTHEDVQIKVLDTLALVQADGQRDYQKEPAKYMLIIQDFGWALAVDRLCSTQVFKADQIRWRSKLRQQAWLCGTVIDEMCALLDGQKLAYTVSQKPEAIALELAQLTTKI